MPKIKTHRGAAKRFRKTKKGKMKRNKACKGHLLAGKNKKRKRRLRKATTTTKTEAKMLMKLMPYG